MFRTALLKGFYASTDVFYGWHLSRNAGERWKNKTLQTLHKKSFEELKVLKPFSSDLDQVRKEMVEERGSNFSDKDLAKAVKEAIDDLFWDYHSRPVLSQESFRSLHSPKAQTSFSVHMTMKQDGAPNDYFFGLRFDEDQAEHMPRIITQIEKGTYKGVDLKEAKAFAKKLFGLNSKPKLILFSSYV